MSVRTCRWPTLSVCVLSLTAFCLSGCRSQHKCGDLWDAPTVQAMRALVVVPAEELKILRVDGRNVQPYEKCARGTRRYLIPSGEHTLTAAFRYAAPVGDGLLGEVRGYPIELTQDFPAGQEYTAVYSIHPYERPEPRFFLEAVIDTLFTPVDYYWSLELVEGVHTRLDTQPAPAQALSAPTRPSQHVEVTSNPPREVPAHQENVAETVARMLAQQHQPAP